jgi:protein tyrosine/serine phosphatase
VKIHQRELAWEGLLNVRDLGGHSTEDGGETKYGRIVRADSIRRLTEAGWQALLDYGVRTIIDLRTDEERQADPPAELPLEIEHISLFDEDPVVFMKVESVVDQAPDVATGTRDVYLVFLESFKHNVARALRGVADAPEGGVVVHCMGGKDRTGLITAFLLHIAGVPTEELAADYALSEERLRPRHEEWFAAAETDAELERIKRIAQTPAESIVGVFEELERRYGSVEDYLQSGGLGEEDIARLRARLRE